MTKSLQLLLLISLFICTASIKGVSQEEFGQNRVQYHDFEWSYFESEHFNTYYYIGNQDIGKFVIQIAEDNLEKIVEILDFRIETTIDIMVYTDITDANQTNIGIYRPETNIGGKTKILDNKLFVYFTGDHRELEEQVRRGIATIFINKMLFGVNFQEVLQNAVLLNLPSWFVDGLIDYIGKPWSVELDNRLAEGILNGKFKKIKKLEAKDARFMGHAFWHYLEMTYGESAVPNLLYLTRINRSLESGFLFVLGSSVNEALKEWYDFNLARYAEERDSKDILRKKYTLDSRINKKKIYYQLRL
ncbi:MAG: hypothetical protein HKN92_03675, partial [Chitinophagales bacterium]|nr:hypothetical protein [Chitinophagales bacterium]